MSPSPRRSPPRCSSRIPKLSEKERSIIQEETLKLLTSIEADAAKVGINDVVANKDGMVGTADSTTGIPDSPPPDYPNTNNSAVTTCHSPVAANLHRNAEVQMAANAHSPPPADQDTTDSAVNTPHSPVATKTKKATKPEKAKLNATAQKSTNAKAQKKVDDEDERRTTRRTTMSMM